MKTTITTIGLYLCAAAVLLSGCGEAIDYDGEPASATQPLVTPEVTVNGDSEGDSAGHLPEMQMEVWLIPTDGVGEPHLIEFSLGEEGDVKLPAGDDVVLPEPGDYQMELVVNPCDDCDSMVPESGDEYGSHLLRSSDKSDSGEENDGSPLPLPGVPSEDDVDEDDVDEGDDEWLSFAHLMQSERPVDSSPVQLQGGDYVIEIELAPSRTGQQGSASTDDFYGTDCDGIDDLDAELTDELDGDVEEPESWEQQITVELVEL